MINAGTIIIFKDEADFLANCERFHDDTIGDFYTYGSSHSDISPPSCFPTAFKYVLDSDVNWFGAYIETDIDVAISSVQSRLEDIIKEEQEILDQLFLIKNERKRVCVR